MAVKHTHIHTCYMLYGKSVTQLKKKRRWFSNCCNRILLYSITSKAVPVHSYLYICIHMLAIVKIFTYTICICVHFHMQIQFFVNPLITYYSIPVTQPTFVFCPQLPYCKCLSSFFYLLRSGVPCAVDKPNAFV